VLTARNVTGILRIVNKEEVMEDNELLFCPFCEDGGEPKLKHTGGQRQEWWVECVACYAEMGGLNPKAEAVRLWNTRYKGEA
jgi:Restriction alleviation protein Lar